MDPVLGAAAIAAIASIVNTFLQRRASKKITETHKQTTQNGHKHDPPTIPDLLSTLSVEVKGLHTRLDKHEEWHRKN
jgi:hypothetical protein